MTTLLNIPLIGLLDTLEFKFFNPRVFYIHNFPDIVPRMKPGPWAAFVSGVKCSWFIYLPLMLLHHVLEISGKSILIMSVLEFTACLIFMMCGENRDIFDNHNFFYFIYTLGEIGILIHKFVC